MDETFTLIAFLALTMLWLWGVRRVARDLRREDRANPVLNRGGLPH